MMIMYLPRLAELKLVDRQWRRVARRVLTSNEWLSIGNTLHDGSTLSITHLPDQRQMVLKDQRLRKKMRNLRSMQRAIVSQWTTIQLPCRVWVTLEGDNDIETFGTLEDLSVDEDLRIRTMILSVDGQRFFSAHCVYEFLCDGDLDDSPLNVYGDADDVDLSEWLLSRMSPMLPDSTRDWAHPDYMWIQSHLLDRTREIRRASGATVRN